MSAKTEEDEAVVRAAAEQREADDRRREAEVRQADFGALIDELVEETDERVGAW